MAGEQWKEKLLGGSLQETEAEFLKTGMHMVGREMTEVRAPEELDDMDAGNKALADRPRRPPQHSTETMACWQGSLFDPLDQDADQRMRLAIVTDCDKLCQWVNGTWRLSNPNLQTPLKRILLSLDSLRHEGARPPTLASD